MATEAQVLANRSNAQKSTGPCTPEGKTKVAQNAVKHGLLAQTAVLQGEDGEEYTCFREKMLEELDPSGMAEEELAARIVCLSWRLRRAARSQDAAFEALYDRYAGGQSQSQVAEAEPSLDPDGPADGGAVVGRMLVEDFGGERVLDRLLVYERRIESSLYRTMAELRRLRDQQESGRSQGKPAAEDRFCETKPIGAGVSSLDHQVSSERSPAAGPPMAPSLNSIAPNKANFPAARQGCSGGQLFKQSQSSPDVEKWARAGRPGAPTEERLWETKPIRRAVSSVKCQV